jgi:hypothetical protein
MTKLEKYTPILIMLLMFALTACKRPGSPAQQTSASSAEQEFQHAEGGTTPPETKYFKGSIGSTLGLQMKLLRQGNSLTGIYFYQKVGTKIDVRGTLDKDGNLLLEEFDAQGKQTGVFTGIWKPESDGLIAIAGNWNKPNSDKKTAFSLHEEPIFFTTGVDIAARQIKENNKKLKYEIEAEYPQITGSTEPNYEKFNQAARAIVLRKVGDFRKEMAPQEDEVTLDSPEEGSESMRSDLGIGYSVALARDDLISVEFSVGTYYRGAAHPNSYTEPLNFDLKNGKAIRLLDVFKPGSKYLQAISSYSIQDLKKQSKEKGADAMLDDDWIQRGAGPAGENYKSWTITQKGLAVNFDSYQVAPYAAGPQEVLIPYSALKDIIKPDGPLGQFVK